MGEIVTIDAFYSPSEDVVAREIEGELIIVPISAGIGDMEDELYTLNETGKAIWNRLDGKHSLHQISKELAIEYDSLESEIERDVVGLITELLNRRILVVIQAGD